MIHTSRRLLLLAVPLSLLASCASPTGDRGRDQSQAIEAVVRAQEAAWNRGDLEGFMGEGYLKSPELTFFAGGDGIRGYDNMPERYDQRYRKGGGEMGRLTFSELETFNYGPDSGLVRGRWRLE